MLHVGHVRYLQGAAAEADRLIVAVNDDAIGRRLKGPGRPAMPAAERAEIVAALDAVDYVLTFADDNRRPAAHRDQTRCPLQRHRLHGRHRAGTCVVKAYGGRTAIVGDPKHHASRDLLKKITSNDNDNCPGSFSSGSAHWATSFTPFRSPQRFGGHFPPRNRLARQRQASRVLDLVPVIDRRLAIGTASCDRSPCWLARRSDPGRPAGTSLLAAIGELRQTRYDVVVDLQGLAQIRGARPALGGAAHRRLLVAYLRERLARPFYTDVYDPGGGGMYDPSETIACRADEPWAV